MIDWTQPIETTETPPRPVRVLFDSDGGVYGVDIETNLWGICSDKVSVCRRDDNGMGTHFITLRNVAPPKPVPGDQEFHDSLVAERDSLKAENEELRGRLNAWNDGTASACARAMIQTADDLAAERDSLKAEVEHCRMEIAALCGWSTPKKTAAEAVANVAKMMGPVKTCGTCKWGHIYKADQPCTTCSVNDRSERNSKWETKQ
jgi:hypothetical protein